MTFAHRIKQEILDTKISFDQARTLVQGIIYSAATIKDEKYVLMIKNSVINNDILSLLKKINLIEPQFYGSTIILNKDKLGDINLPKLHNTQFAAGLFIVGGSISDSRSSAYHLEIKFINEKNAKEAMIFFNKYKFDFHFLQRKNYYIIYIKKSEHISDFLRAIGSYGGVMEFEEFRINRDFKNNLNRISNLEVNNQKKIVQSSIELKKQIEKLKKKNLLHKLSAEQQYFIEIRLKHKYSSLSDIVEIMKEQGYSITKSGLNHWLIKIRNLAS